MVESLWWDLKGIKMTNRSVKISYLRAVQLLSLILLSINNVSIPTLQSIYESYDVTSLIRFSYTIFTDWAVKV